MKAAPSPGAGKLPPRMLLPALAPHLSVPLHFHNKGFLIEESLQPLVHIVVVELFKSRRSLASMVPWVVKARSVHHRNGGHGEVLGGERPGERAAHTTRFYPQTCLSSPFGGDTPSPPQHAHPWVGTIPCSSGQPNTPCLPLSQCLLSGSTRTSWHGSFACPFHFTHLFFDLLKPSISSQPGWRHMARTAPDLTWEMLNGGVG